MDGLRRNLGAGLMVVASSLLLFAEPLPLTGR